MPAPCTRFYIGTHVHRHVFGGWINLPICRQFGCDPSNIVLHRNPASPPSRKGAIAPQLSILTVNSWMDEDATWQGFMPRHNVLQCGTMCYTETHIPALKGGRPSVFGPCPLWPRSLVSPTAEVLFIVCCVAGVHSSISVIGHGLPAVVAPQVR